MILLTTAKFNCTVPGTRYSYSSACPSTTMPTTLIETTEPNKNTAGKTLLTTFNGATTTTNITAFVSDLLYTDNQTTHAKTILEVGSPLFYGVVATGGGILAFLALCVFCVCAVLAYKRNKTEGK